MTQPTTFEEAGVGADLSATLAQRDIIAPFPVQQMVIPLALEGRDVQVKAPTGSGKTLAFGLPVIIGPKYGKFGEAVAMIAQGGMYSVRNAEELSEAFTALLPADRYEKAQNAARVFIESNKGATESIMKYIAQRELL